MAGTIVVDNIQSDSSYASTINVQSKINFTGGIQVGGSDSSLSNRNLIHNGNMIVCQKPSSYTNLTTSAVAFPATDRYRIELSNMGTWTMNCEVGAPISTGFSNSTNLICTTANTSPPAISYLIFEQNIEGRNVQRLKFGSSAAENLTLSFWIKTNKIGTYVVELFVQAPADGSTYRRVAKTFTVNATNTWEKKTLSYPGDTVMGIADTISTGLTAFFWLGAGTTYTSGTTTGLWESYNSNPNNRCAGLNVNPSDTVGNYYAVTGIQLETGSFATPFEFEDYATTLAKCQRYYWQTDDRYPYSMIGQGFIRTTTGYNAVTIQVPFPQIMRTQPAVSNTAAATPSFTGQVANWSTNNITYDSSWNNGTDTRMAWLDFTAPTNPGWSVGQAASVYRGGAGSCHLKFSAEI